MITHWIRSKDGKEYPVRFTNSIGLQIAVQEGVPTNEIQKFLSGFMSWPIGLMYRYYYLAFKKGAKAENREFNLSEEDFIDLIADDETVMEQASKALIASYPEQEKKTQQKQESKKR